MKITFPIIAMLLHCLAYAQDIPAPVKLVKKEIQRSSSEAKPYTVNFIVNTTAAYAADKENLLTVTIDQDSTTLSKNDYELIEPLKEVAIQKNEGKHLLTLRIKPNKKGEKDSKTIVFNVAVFNKDKVTKVYSQRLTLTVSNEDESLADFRYLAYIGTNFDLVDGLKAKNLFFATNIFLPPLKKGSVGMYVSLYGNRTSMSRDSIPDLNRERVNTDTIAPYRQTETYDAVVTTVSDNLGAFCAPLFRLWRCSDNENNIKLYYSPSLEFLWRRGVTKIDYVNRRLGAQIPVDSTDYRTPGVTYLSSSNTIKTDIYDFNVGFLSLFLSHENDRISLRLNLNVGKNFRYSSGSSDTRGTLTRGGTLYKPGYESSDDLFFSGKLWITERVSGLTVEGEVTNNSRVPGPYYGVTLSKAIDFSKLGNVFAPISSRSSK